MDVVIVEMYKCSWSHELWLGKSVLQDLSAGHDWIL
jgi:hypothetical protein